MSSSSEFSGQQTVKSPEKSHYSQTCNLLSQYVKERAPFGDLSLGRTRNGESTTGLGTPELSTTTMNFFPIVEKSNDVLARNMATSPNLKSMDLFPQQAGFGSSSSEDVTKMTVSSVNKPAAKEPETAQMTIFYGGQVIVFNDFPAEKAKEVMFLAGKGSSHPAFVSTSSVKNSTESGSLALPSPPTAVSNVGNNLIQDYIQRPHQPISCDLPIARKASLHRFLEKRKDRITARSPYQTTSSDAAPHKQAQSDLWLGLAAQSPQQFS